MIDLNSASDPYKKLKFGMTINRAIYDSLICVTTEIPYVSKSFFFNCLDKLSNLLKQLGFVNNETNAWKILISENFLEEDVKRTIMNLKGNCCDYFTRTIDYVTREMNIGKINPDLLRSLRNSHHGYNLHPNNFNALIRHSGEINNDITSIITPLILYFLSIKWDF